MPVRDQVSWVMWEGTFLLVLGEGRQDWSCDSSRRFLGGQRRGETKARIGLDW